MPKNFEDPLPVQSNFYYHIQCMHNILHLKTSHCNLYPNFLYFPTLFSYDNILLFSDTGKEYVVEFDFLGKDSIQYHNDVAVEKRVFKNLTLFKDGKKTGDDLFDRLNTSILNEYLTSLMPGLTAKVFRTYNASITLQEQLKELTDEDDNLAAKVLSYNR